MVLDRRRVLGLLTGVGAAGLTSALSGCGAVSGSSSPKSPVRLGLLVPATGAYKNIGADLEKGFRLYLDMHEGKFSGHPIELLVADEGGTIKSGTAAFDELLQQGAVAITGVANPDLLPALRDMVEKNQVPLLAAHGAAADMSSAIYIWRTAFKNDEPGRAIGLHLKSTMAKRVSSIGMLDTFTKDVIGGLLKECGNVTDPIYLPPGTKPDSAAFRDAVQQLFLSAPDAVFCALPSTHLVPFLQQFNSLGGKSPVYAPGLVTEMLAENQLSLANGLYTATPYASDLNNPSNRVFSAQYQALHQGSPTSFAVAAYDAAAILDGAIALCGDDTITSLRINQEIPKVGQVISPRGNWQFNQERSPQQKWYLRQIRHDGPMWSNVLIGDLATLGYN